MRVRTEEKKRRSEIHERVRKRKMEEIRYIEGNVKNQQEELSLLEHAGEIVEIHGSIYKIRKMRGFAFVLLRTAKHVIQCVYSEEKASFSLEELEEESCVIFQAEVVKEERSRTGVELHLIGMEVLSRPYEKSPVVINQKQVDTSIATLLDYRPVTLRNEKERAIFRIQNGITNAVRRFLQGEGFTEIHTPKIGSAGAEGGANIFRLDYFGKEAYLAQSPQFYKQMMVGVYERVFEIAPVFRAEKHDTSRHLNEYTSVDFEMGYVTRVEELMEMEAAMLKFVFASLKEECQEELALLQVEIPEWKEIPAIPFAKAKEIVARIRKRPVEEPEDLEPEEEKLLSEWILKETGSELVFVTEYPEKKRPFYAMDSETNPNVTKSFDLLYKGLEVTTGGLRIHNYEEQVAKMKRRGMHPEVFESYLMAHKCGLPPHGGLGLGLERFTSRLLGFENVRRASLFPRDIHRLVP